MATKKLFLLDAFALIYRAHFAFIKNPRITSQGLNTSAVFGFTNTLLEVLSKEKPTHIAVCFDTKAPTFRHEQFESYKANRPPQPEDITTAIPYVRRMVKAMNIPLIEMDGYEADDVIGTLAKKAARQGFTVYMYTPDKDYGQLVEENIYLYKPAFMGNGVEVMGVQEILDKWGIDRVEQVVDMLGLMGDKVDNIPGIPGVGEKSALKLIQEFDSIENLIANAEGIAGKLGEKIREHSQSALMSKELARIDINVPVELDEQALVVEECCAEEMGPLLDELEFRTLRRRLLPNEAPADNPAPKATPAARKPAAQGSQIDLFETATSSNQDFLREEVSPTPAGRKNIHTRVHEYHIMDTPERQQALVRYLLAQKEVAFDTETTNLEATDAELVGLSFAYKAAEAYYVPVSANREEVLKTLAIFQPFFESTEVIKIAQNLKYDMSVLANYGVELAAPLYDTLLAHYLLEPEQRHGMDALAENYLNYQTVEIEELIGKKGKNQKNMRQVPLAEIAVYAAEDADVTLQLKHVFEQKLAITNQTKLLTEVEVPLVGVLMRMEREGVAIDTKALSELSEGLQTDLQRIQSDIFEIAGTEFNISSPKQLGEILFEKLKIDAKPKKTPTGQYATGEEILSNYENDYEIARKILDFRELQKLKSTYVDALPQLISPRTGRVHTTFNQAVAATGRLSSTNPNLQNIPIRTERGREIRKAFIPRSGEYKILSADYSQIELRIMAGFSGDESMIQAFNENQDIHAITASKVFGVPLPEVTSDMRRKAKSVNFGIIYGISAFGLARNINISRSEAQEIINNYFVQFPKVKSFMDASIQKAREQEYVETLLGRRRYLPDINSRNPTNRGFAERNAINAPIQGTAADMIKLAMIHIDEYIRKEKLRSRMILQVHDELVFDVHEAEVKELKDKVNELMITALPIGVEIETGIGLGENWLQAH